MDPCPFVRLIIESIALKLPIATKPACPGVHPSSAPCFCKLRIKNFPSQTVIIPLCSSATPSDHSPPDPAASFTGNFHLDLAALRRLSGRPIVLSVSVYTGRMGHTCGISSGRLLGCVNLDGVESTPAMFHDGWMKVGGGSEPDKPVVRLHLTVRNEPDPRFVFQFGGEPECSPVVFQIWGNIRQN